MILVGVLRLHPQILPQGTAAFRQKGNAALFSGMFAFCLALDLSSLYPHC
jgi:hypothetical protein